MCRVCPVHPGEHGHLPYVDGDALEHGCRPMSEWPHTRPLPTHTEGPVITLHTRASLEKMVHKGLRRLGIRALTLPWEDK